MTVVGAYAPVSGHSQRHKDEREKFRRELQGLLEKTENHNLLVIGGDMNAEVGAEVDSAHRDVLGAFGDRHRTKSGEELIEFCREEGLSVASSFFQEKCKHTWWHMRYGSGHQLDMFLVRNTQRWQVRRCHTLHYGTRQGGEARRRAERAEATRSTQRGEVYRFEVEYREDGAIAWEPYTDHDPIEIVIATQVYWNTIEKEKMEPEPDWTKLWGNNERAEEMRKKLEQEIEATMSRGIGGDGWEEVCNTVIATSFQVLGERKKPHPRQWLVGKEDEKARLEAARHAARHKLHEVNREENLNTEEQRLRRRKAKKECKEASRECRRKMRQWENDWWNEIGQRMTEAAHRGDQAEMYKLFNELKIRHEGRKDRGKKVSDDKEAEREAWRAHFEKVSEDPGEVPEHVWDNVTRIEETTTVLGETPTDVELDRCVSKMKNKRRPGNDRFTVELLKYGGKQLRMKAYEIVRDMWKKAGEAGNGQEGRNWPEGWNIGLVVPPCGSGKARNPTKTHGEE